MDDQANLNLTLTSTAPIPSVLRTRPEITMRDLQHRTVTEIARAQDS
jgi:hypothetical protein